MRASPAFIDTKANLIRKFAQAVAKESEDLRPHMLIIIPSDGYYRCNTDQAVFDDHKEDVLSVKADIGGIRYRLVSEVTLDERKLMLFEGSSDQEFLKYLREHVDERFELNSPVTLVFCSNFRGRHINEAVRTFKIVISRGSSKE